MLVELKQLAVSTEREQNRERESQKPDAANLTAIIVSLIIKLPSR